MMHIPERMTGVDIATAILAVGLSLSAVICSVALIIAILVEPWA